MKEVSMNERVSGCGGDVASFFVFYVFLSTYNRIDET